ncbi:MAG TPA: 4-(cytidine 5'-diphospho)-2-C-methyl-D-erythritol kinase [Chloroflexota bacterium]|nr:4-(cytidine 5'-diphospho)-2-C-methyl-D-erythritol kinase [Chloroflexota bacterium]
MPGSPDVRRRDRPQGAGGPAAGAGPRVAVAAPAKVNLTLEVLRRRPDGYHDLCSVMQALSLADRLEAVPAESLSLECSIPALAGQDNLVWRAADLLRRETGAGAGARLWLEKRIPVAAGLGGGSSDAASALLALNALWRLGLSRADLCALGARIGSDVPFFLGSSACALAEGRGERLTPLPALPHRAVVLARLPVPVSTAAVFGAFPPPRWADGRRTAAWRAASAGGTAVPPPFDDLEPVTLGLTPAAARAREALLAAGAPRATLSGSGPTYFALFDPDGTAETVYERLRAGRGAGVEALLTGFGALATI